MVKFNGALYSYVHNLQGDIVGIVDNAGSLAVEYKYDAWGKPTLVRTLTAAYEALAELNPFRYRGYVYDEETGLYYLRNRYYDASSQRFLNADAIIFMGSCNSKWQNLYAYCINTPINRLDISGSLSQLISFAIGIVKAVLSFAKNIFKGIGSTKSLAGARKVSTSSSQRKEVYARGVLAQNVEDLRNEWLEMYPAWDFYKPYILKDYLEIGPWFAEKFGEGGVYDYKDGGRGVFEAGETFTFMGEEVTLEDFGNINYGYVGVALGFHPFFLELGAAYNHWTKHGNTPEDSRDQEMVQLGMIMAMEDYGYMYEDYYL